MREYLKELIEKSDYYDPVRDRVLALKFGRIKNEKVLDIGTGSGKIAVLAAKRGCSVTSVDIEEKPKAHALAREEGVRIDFRVEDASRLPFLDNSFDSAIAFNALHHCRNQEKVIDEMLRVARKILITELNQIGARAFDEYIHPEENHMKRLVDPQILIDKLEKKGEVKIMQRKFMNTFLGGRK